VWAAASGGRERLARDSPWHASEYSL